MPKLFSSFVIAIAFAISHAGSCPQTQTQTQTVLAQEETAKATRSSETRTADQVNGTDAARNFIKTIDKNGDEKISKDEAPDQLKATFQYIDLNNDDLIDAKEAQAIVDYIAKGGADAQTSSPAPAAKMASKSVTTTSKVTAKQLVDAMDANKDSRISKSEASEDLILYFENYDTNNDKLIDLNEAQAMATFVNRNSSFVEQASTQSTPAVGTTSEAKQLIAPFDSNQDGKISLKEAPAELKPYFSQFDSNGDGVIDIAEARVLVPLAGGNQLSSEATTKKAAKGAKKEPAQTDPRNPMPGKVTANDLMKQMDLNSDGKITKAEAPQELKASFQYVDTNGDGGIDKAEAQNMADYVNKNGGQ